MATKKIEKKVRESLLIGMGLFNLSAKKVRQEVSKFCKEHKINTKEADKVTKDFLKKATAEKKNFESLVKKELNNLQQKAKKPATKEIPKRSRK